MISDLCDSSASLFFLAGFRCDGCGLVPLPERLLFPGELRPSPLERGHPVDYRLGGGRWGARLGVAPRGGVRAVPGRGLKRPGSLAGLGGGRGTRAGPGDGAHVLKSSIRSIAGRAASGRNKIR